jgi:hypothetical protein
VGSAFSATASTASSALGWALLAWELSPLLGVR